MSEERRFSGELDEDETFWRDHALWLKERGYQLRSRYQPTWKPSWLSKNSSRNRYNYEDSRRAKEPSHLMDGLRITDERLVMFKKLRLNDPTNPTRELRMSQLFSSGFLPSDSPHNHCVPIYEILKVPEDEHENLIVMPFLEDWWPYWWELPFDTVGEAMGFIRQLFEGVQSLHHHHIAHNDIKWDNIMVDSAPLYRRLQHPTENRYTYDWKGQLTRRSLTRYPVKYFFIDFDLSRKYDLETGPPREPPGYGGDRSVPEFKSRPHDLCDPFPVEIYRLGNFIRRFLMSSQQYHELDDVDDLRYNHSLDFLSELVTDMTQDDPTKRPNIDQVVERFDEIVKKLGFFKLRSQFWPGYSGNWLVRVLWKTPRHIMSQVINFLGRYSPIPPTPGPPKGRKSR